MIWISGLLLAAYAVVFALQKTHTRRSDAAGNALVSAYWFFAAMAALGFWRFPLASGRRPA
jgi:hypothetical protein